MMIDGILREYKLKIDSRLDIIFPITGQPYDIVSEASRYSLLEGGKRIRPILLLEFYKLCGGNDDCAYNFACALEMIHTYSLIHDDLPCMDNDDMRRGKPSCHIAYGESMALLAGDNLLTEAFKICAKTQSIPAERVNKAIAYLASAAGTTSDLNPTISPSFAAGASQSAGSESAPCIAIAPMTRTAAAKGTASFHPQAVPHCATTGDSTLSFAFRPADAMSHSREITPPVATISATATRKTT